MKEEYETSLDRSIMVMKNHPRIVFRGKIDSFLANIMCLQAKYSKNENTHVVDKLDSVFRYMKEIQRCEVLEENIPELKIFDFSMDEIRTRSHNPKKYYGRDHLFNMDYTFGELVCDMDLLRALSRELEISAINAYILKSEYKRSDIIKAMNILSSAIYLLELMSI